MVIDHLDLTTKHIYLAEGVRSYHPVDDIYKEIRYLRRTNEAYRGTHTPVVASGNVAKGGGKFTPRLATFNCGWKIVPEDISHILYVTGEQITSEGESGPACFDLEPLSANSKVIIQYEPPLAEVIERGVSGLTKEESNRLTEILAIKSQADNIKVDTGELQYQVGEAQWQIANIEETVNRLPDEPAESGEYSALLEAIQSIIAFIKQIEWGRWKIEDNQMIFYDTDNITPIRVFNLKNKKGEPAEKDVYERIPV